MNEMNNKTVKKKISGVNVEYSVELADELRDRGIDIDAELVEAFENSMKAENRDEGSEDQ